MNGPVFQRRGVFTRFAALAILCFMGGIAGAQDNLSPPMLITLGKGQALLETFAAPFETVITGDPAIVATSVVSDTHLVLTARAAGQTNIIVLAADGSIQARWDVLVPTEHRASIYRGATRIVVTCNPICQPVPTLENGQP